MTADLLQLNSQLQKEADDLLNDTGLLALLKEYGPVIFFGSYVHGLMTWRDLDICIETEDFAGDILSLTGRLASLLQPYEMFHVNSIRFAADLGGRGIYWGIQTDNTPESWKLDIWAFPPCNCRFTESRTQYIREHLNEENRKRILEIKAAFCHLPEYRRRCWNRWNRAQTFGSNDIYTAVFDHGVINATEFRHHWKKQRSTAE